MTDNYYYVEDLVSNGYTNTLTDDGTGNDWLILRNSHDSNAISLSWWSVRGTSTEAESIYFIDNVASSLIVIGHIENARGATGDDWIRGNEANNILYGDAVAEGSLGGDDTLDGAEGDDTIYGGTGNDDVTGGAGNDLLFGNLGNDTILAGSGADAISGDEGNDTILAGVGADTVAGGAGADSLNGGGNRGDLLTYADSSDGVQVSITYGAVTTGVGGDAEGDRITGFYDVVGSDSSDVLTDTIATNLGAGQNANLFDGGLGNDTLSMGGGNDTALGGRGNDVISGESGNDSLSGGIGRDNISGGSGNDSASGGLGTDLINGDTGNDTIDGGDGNDTLFGDAGDDVLISDRGSDILTGGSGADRFVFGNVFDSGAGAGFDTITDFNSADGDTIDLSGIDANRYAAGDASFTFRGTSTFTGAGAELRVVQTADGWLVQGDLDGDRTADFVLTLTGDTIPVLLASDFVL